jgi:NADPH:quinone reductase-like Zn-dependent oxidoreductase
MGYIISWFSIQIPPHQSFDSAATVPLGLDTAVIGMYGERYGAGLTPPWAEIGDDNKSESKGPIVIIGGSSSVGAYGKTAGTPRLRKPHPNHITAVQLARLSGFYPIITTASPSNEQLVKNYGATHFFDRHLSSDQFNAAVSEVTDSPIGIVYDAISLPETQKIGWELLAENGILILTLAAAVEEDEGKGRKAIPTHGTPHAPENQELCRNS